MEGRNKKQRDDIFSKPIRAGKRTYFFDVKATRNDDYYLIITESKKRMDDDGKFHYDKHKIFLYKEDINKFAEGLQSIIDYIKAEKGSDYLDRPEENGSESHHPVMENGDDGYRTDINFDDLDDDK
jgi:hypothetical protein